MKVTYSTSQPEAKTTTSATAPKTDEFLFAENNKQSQIKIQAEMNKPIEPAETPTIIGALLSTFADEIINLLGGEDSTESDRKDEDNNPDEKVTAANSKNTSYLA